jgi:crossover junction endodeoxyribonuclease RusA
MPLKLRLPWPPKELSPNARVHWAEKQRETRAYRWECFSEARPYRYLPQCRATGPRSAKVVFVVPNKRKRDLDNCMAMLKPCWDGLVDAGVLVDDDSKHLKLGAPEMRVQKGEKYVEVTLS